MISHCASPITTKKANYKAIALGLLGVLLLPSCSGQIVQNPSSVEILSAANLPNTPAKPYRIGVGDQVEVKFFFVPELNEVAYVRPDGKISVMFVQDIEAAGKTPEELADAIKDKITSHIKQWDLVVIIRNAVNQKVYVGGEVAKPGSILMAGQPTLLQVLIDAGWVTPFARRNEIVLVRRDDDNQDRVYALNIDNIINGTDVSQNIMIHPGDQIIVPPSNVVEFDRWVDQHIRQALPFSANASAVYSNQNVNR